MNIEEAKMQNYKIKVANKAESKEAQELLFGLGYGWKGKKQISTSSMKCIFATTVGGLWRSNQVDWFDERKGIEITLPQLRDLAVLHRNDVGDATHKSSFCKDSYYIGEQTYFFKNGKWHESLMGESSLIPIEPQMTWQDALRAVADGKEVQMTGLTDEWEDIAEFHFCRIIRSDSEFRLKPQVQRKELNGNFTKEELLKIAGEMV